MWIKTKLSSGGRWIKVLMSCFFTSFCAGTPAGTSTVGRSDEPAKGDLWPPHSTRASREHCLSSPSISLHLRRWQDREVRPGLPAGGLEHNFHWSFLGNKAVEPPALTVHSHLHFVKRKVQDLAWQWVARGGGWATWSNVGRSAVEPRREKPCLETSLLIWLMIPSKFMEALKSESGHIWRNVSILRYPGDRQGANWEATKTS